MSRIVSYKGFNVAIKRDIQNSEEVGEVLNFHENTLIRQGAHPSLFEAIKDYIDHELGDK